MTTGVFPFTDSKGHQLTIRENNQNSLKGIIWGVAAAALTPSALVITAYTTSAVVLGTLSIGNIESSKIPVLIAAIGVSILFNRAAIKYTGTCMKNMIYHLGPKFEIVKA